MPAPTLPLETPAADTRQPSAEAIRFEDVSLAFDDKQVLDDISFRLAHGETKALFGVAGSGKSTILKLALGLMKPDSGRIYVLGEEVTQMSEKDLFKLRGRSWNGVSGERAVRFVHGAGKRRVSADRRRRRLRRRDRTAGARGPEFRGTGTHRRHVSRGAVRRNAAPGGDCAGDHHAAGSHSVRFADRRT